MEKLFPSPFAIPGFRDLPSPVRKITYYSRGWIEKEGLTNSTTKTLMSTIKSIFSIFCFIMLLAYSYSFRFFIISVNFSLAGGTFFTSRIRIPESFGEIK